MNRATSTFGVGAVRDLRVVACAWVGVPLAGMIPLAALPAHPREVYYSVVGWLVIVALVPTAAVVQRDRAAIANDKDLASLWTTVASWIAIMAFVYGRWVGLGGGLLLVGYVLVLRHQARIVADQRLIEARQSGGRP